MAPETVPRVSVVVFVRDRDTKVFETLRSLELQERFADIEVILADGHPHRKLGEVARDFPWVRYLWLPGQNMPRLKGAAIEVARADIVAILDPWDVAPPDWIGEIMAALEDQGVTVVGGVVELGGAATAANRAAYIVEYGAFNPPQPAGPTAGEMPGNNLALRRAALVEHCGDILESEGFNKPLCQARLRERGATFVIRPAMRVRHLTAHRLVPFAVSRFHYARCFGATRRRLGPWSRKLLYCVFAPVVPFLLIGRHLARARRHPSNRRLLRGSVLALMAVCAVWGTGEWIGCWLGAGRSCDKLY